MNKKQTLVRKFNELRTRLSFVMAAGVIGLTGCATSKQEQQKLNLKNIDEIIHQIDEEIIQDNHLEQAQDIINDVNRLIPELNVDEQNIEQDSLQDQTMEEVNFFDTIDISNYHGNSIVDALRTSGYGYSFAFREELAEHFGIKDYRGTAKQNLELLVCLRGNQIEQVVFKEGQTQKENIQDHNKVKDHDQLQNGTGSVNHEEQNDQTVTPGVTNPSDEVGVNPDGTLKNEVNNGTNLVGPGSDNSSSSSNNEDHTNYRPGSGSNSRPGSGSGSTNGGNNGNQNSGNTDNDNKKPSKPDSSGNTDDNKKPNPSDPSTETHKHDIKTEISYNKKGNGIHETVIKESCTAGDYLNIINKNENCTYEIVFYDDEHEDLKCPKCGDTKTRNHNPIAGKPLENGDIPYTCGNAGCDWTFIKQLDEECNHDYEVVGYDDEHEDLKCPKCGDIKTRGHDLDKGVVQADGSIVYSCKHKGCNYTKTETKSDECTHDNWIVVSFNENNEYLKCPKCGDTKTRGHDLDEGVPQEDGSILYSCKHEGCNYTKTETKSDECTHENWIVVNYDDEHEDLKCPKCGDTKTRDHDPIAGEPLESGDIPYFCGNAGCDWTFIKQLDEECNHDYEIVFYDDEHEDLKCPKCGDTKTRDHNPIAGEPLENGDIPYFCGNAGCDWTFIKQLDDECNHEYEVVGYDDEHEDLKCPKCGDTKTRNHKKVSSAIDGNGKFTDTCENEGCDWLKERHIHIKEEDEVIVGTKDVCTKTVTVCIVDGCTEKFPDQINSDHKFRVTSEGVKKECRVCGYDPRKETKKSLKENMVDEEMPEETTSVTDEYSEEEKVTKESLNVAEDISEDKNTIILESEEESEISNEILDSIVFEKDFEFVEQETDSYENLEEVDILEQETEKQEEKGMARKLVLEEE